MLVVKLEIQSAVTGQTTEIGRCVIVHDDDVSNPDIGNYDVIVNSNAYSSNGALSRTAKVKEYPRRALNVWRLVSRALRNAFPEERETQDELVKALDAAVKTSIGTVMHDCGEPIPVVAIPHSTWQRIYETYLKLDKNQ